MIDTKHLDTLSELLGKEAMNKIRLDYVADSAEKMQGLLVAWQTKNYEEIGQVSHSLKSSSANMSLPLFAAQCQLIEQAAFQQQEEGIQEAIDQLPELYEKSLQALADYFSNE